MKPKITREPWIRLAILIVSLIIVYPIAVIITFIILIQIVISLIKGSSNKQLEEFSKAGLKIINDTLKYLLFASNKKPLNL